MPCSNVPLKHHDTHSTLSTAPHYPTIQGVCGCRGPLTQQQSWQPPPSRESSVSAACRGRFPEHRPPSAGRQQNHLGHHFHTLALPAPARLLRLQMAACKHRCVMQSSAVRLTGRTGTRSHIAPSCLPELPGCDASQDAGVAANGLSGEHHAGRTCRRAPASVSYHLMTVSCSRIPHGKRSMTLLHCLLMQRSSMVADQVPYA